MGRSSQTVLGLFAAAILAAMVYQVTAAHLRPPTSTRLYGADAVWRGHTAAFRILCVDTDGVTPCAHPHLRAGFVDAAHRALGLQVDADAAGLVRLPVPAALPDAAFVAVCSQDGNRTPVDYLWVPVRGRDRPTIRGPSHGLPLAASTADIAVALYPDTGVLVGGLPASGVGVLSAAGRPWATGLHAPAEGPWRVDAATDARGTFSWHAQPSAQPAPWQLQLAGRADVLRIAAHPQPRQMTLTAAGPGVWAGGQQLSLQLSTLPFRGPLQLDTWAGDCLVAGEQVQAGSVPVTLPTGYTGPVQMTAYRQAPLSETTFASVTRWVYAAGTAPETAQAQARVWLGLQGEADTAPAHAAGPSLAAHLNMVVPMPAGIPLRVDSHAARQAAFAAAQSRRQKLGQSFLTTAGSVGTLCLVAYVRHGLQRRRARLTAAWPDGGAAARTQQVKMLMADSNTRWAWACGAALVLFWAALWRLMGHLLQAPPS
jgi:hypothetical protein